MSTASAQKAARTRWANRMAAQCAVVGCLNYGQPAACPYDGRSHYHGRIHYDCGYPVSRLSFRPGWWLVCILHYAELALERQAWEQERRAEP